MDIKKCDRQCMVANGSNINLETIVSVPMKIGLVLINVYRLTKLSGVNWISFDRYVLLDKINFR